MERTTAEAKSVGFCRIGLVDIFLQQVRFYPDKLAVVTNKNSLSYKELFVRSSILARSLQASGIELEEPVGILLDAGVNHVVSQLAILMAGGSCMPINPSSPGERLDFMLQEAGVKLTISCPELIKSGLRTEYFDFNEWDASGHELFCRNSCVLDNHRAFVMFTSGTTGRPKGVEIEARGIIRMVVNSSLLAIDACDRVAAISNPAFDGALLEIWGALLNGATLYFMEEATDLLDPRRMERFIQNNEISIMLLTTSLFNFMAPHIPLAFGSLSYLLVGGEVFNVQALKSIGKSGWPRVILNSYGPTEGTTLTLCHTIRLEDLDVESMPIGIPVDRTEVFILDKDLRVMPVKKVGEIYIAGAGLARGYINRPELTKEKFLLIDVPGEAQPLRVYKTGDLGWRDCHGVVTYAGRVDNQIKLQGYRIEIEEIEARLLQSDFFYSAVACLVKVEGGEGYIQAFVVPKNVEGFDGAEVLSYLRTYLPAYMMPRIKVVSSIPLNINGKADRTSLVQSIKAELSFSDAGMSDKERELLLVWQKVMRVNDPKLNDDFFELGGTSLQAARLVLEINRKFATDLSIQDLYEAKTPGSLLELILNPKSSCFDLCAKLMEDCALANNISTGSVTLSKDCYSMSQVFLTGATGFFGAFCLHDLLLDSGVKKVFCIVRAENDELALSRIKENLNKYGLWDNMFTRRIHALAGDIEKDFLGLSRENYSLTSSICDCVFHLAARVSFIEPYVAHRSANVIGLVNVLNFASCIKAKSVHYASTIAASGPVGLLSRVSRVYESDDLSSFARGMEYTVGYLQSKWVAEQLIVQARVKGIRVSIYRLGFVFSHSVNGIGNYDDFMGRLIKGCIRVGAYPLLPGDRKELIPVDFASSAMVSIAREVETLNYNYHIIPPERRSISFNSFFELFAKTEYSLVPLSYKQWLKRICDDHDLETNPLMPLLPMLSQRVYKELTAWEVFGNIPVYDSCKTWSILSRCKIMAFPSSDEIMLRRYLDYMKKIGHL